MTARIPSCQQSRPRNHFGIVTKAEKDKAMAQVELQAGQSQERRCQRRQIASAGTTLVRERNLTTPTAFRTATAQ